MKRTAAVGALVIAALASNVIAQTVQSEHFIAIVAHTPGAGFPPTQWATDLVVSNASDTALAVGLMYFPWGPGHLTEWDFTFPVTIQLEPLETRLVEDVLATLFAYAAGTKGSLMVTAADDAFPQNAADGKIMVVTRTYNTGSAAGTFGQTVMATDLFHNATYEPSYVIGARHDTRFRSNLGLMNLSPEEITVHYRIRAAAGTVLAEGAKVLEMLNGGQWSFGDLGVQQVAGVLRVELWLDPTDVTPDVCAVDWHNSFVGYVSKVDGNPDGTGDAEFLPAIPDDFPPADWDCRDED